MNIKILSGYNLCIVLEYHNSPSVFWLLHIGGRAINFEIGHFHNFPTYVTLPWLRIGSYGTPWCSTHWPLPRYQISFKSERAFCGQTDGWMYWRTLRPALLAQIGGVDRKITERQTNEKTDGRTDISANQTRILCHMKFTKINLLSKVHSKTQQQHRRFY